ncbi:reverse transcriptase domain-containing protein, partial [Tanacetum coccineum]
MGTTITTMETTTTTIGMVGTMDVPTKNVLDNSRCSENQKVKYDASSFFNKALTWWNTQIQARGREAAIGMTWNDFKALLVEEFCPSNEIERLENEFWNHKMHTSRAGILTDEAISCGTLSKSNEKRKAVEETGQSRGSLCFNCQRPGHFAKDFRAPFKREDPVNAVRMEFEPGICYKCGSREHFRNTCPKLNRAPGQVGNRLTIKGNRNTRNNRNRAIGRAFNVNVKAVEALQDPNVVT